jgi:plastocyanin
MGQIMLAENPNENGNNNQQGAGNEIRSTSMFDWQYQLQKTLQNPRIINYSDAQLSGIQRDNNSNSDMIAHDNTTTITHPTANANGAAIAEHPLQHDTDNRSGSVIANNLQISIVEGASNPSNEIFYDPLRVAVKRGNSVIWTNNDFIPHTATSGNQDKGEAQTETLLNIGILGPRKSSEEIRIDAADAGRYDYYFTLTPFMKGQLMIED